MDAIKAFSNVFPTSDQFIKLVFTPSSRPEVFCKKSVFRNFAEFSGKHLCQTLFFNNVAGLGPRACNFIKKEVLAQVFSCEFCEISKNTFFHRTPLVAAWGENKSPLACSDLQNLFSIHLSRILSLITNVCERHFELK